MPITKTDKVTYKDVIKWFEDADTEIAGLVFDIVHGKLNAALAKKAEFAARMVKARKGRTRKVNVAAATVSTEPVNGVVADPTIQAEVASQLPVVKRGPGRPRKVAATVAPVATSPSQDPDYQAYLAESEPEVAVAAQQ